MSSKKNSKFEVTYFNYDKEVIEAVDLGSAQKKAHKRAAEKKTLVFTVKEYKDQK